MSRRAKAAGWAVALAAAALLAAVLVPLARAALSMAGRRTALTTLSAQAPVLRNTVVLGAAEASIATLLAAVLAAWQAGKPRGHRVFHALVLAPLVAPPFTYPLALLVIFGHSGVLAQVAGTTIPVYGFGGLLAAGVGSALPLAYLTVLAAERRLDADLIEQARDLGWSASAARRRVAWPRLLPAWGAAWLVVFVEATTDVTGPLVLGGGFTVMPARIYAAVAADDDLGGAAALTLLLAAPTFVAALALRFLSRQTAQARASVEHASGGGARGWGAAVAVVVATANVALLGVVLAGAFLRPGSPPQFTLAPFRAALQGDGSAALGFSLVLALLAAPVTGALALACAWAAERRDDTRRPAFARILDAALLTLGALPGIGVATAIFGLLTMARSGRGPAALFWGPAAGIVAIHVLRTLPRTAAELRLALRSRPRDLDAAARQLGAGPRQRFWLVAWPALREPLLSTGVANVARTLTAVSSVILLTNSQIPLLSPRALVEIDAGRLGPACAQAICLAAIVGLLLVVGRPHPDGMVRR